MATHDASLQNESTDRKKQLFYTTSDMMKTINKSIASLDSPDDAMSPRVELQRRMPDGSTRRANQKDMEAADMESKLKQECAVGDVCHFLAKDSAFLILVFLTCTPCIFFNESYRLQNKLRI